MNRFSRLVVASGNEGKFRELKSLLADFDIEALSRSKWSLPSPSETGLSFVENAIIKARHAALKTGLPALADDSGLVVDVLDGAPGVYSARFAGANATSSDNIEKLLRLLEKKEGENHRAYFHCTLALCRYAKDPIPLLAHGMWEGHILQNPRGEGGFGYDRVFYVKTHGCSAAELAPEEKNQLSHRSLAFHQLRSQMPNFFKKSAD